MTRSTNEIVRIVKMAALQAVEESDPCKIYFGTVVTADPIQIKLDGTSDEILLGERQLILLERVTNHKIEVEIDLESLNLTPINWSTQSSAGPPGSMHSHGISGVKEASLQKGVGVATMKYGLEEGDRVCLIRMQGGQLFIAVDVIERKRERVVEYG